MLEFSNKKNKIEPKVDRSKRKFLIGAGLGVAAVAGLAIKELSNDTEDDSPENENSIQSAPPVSQAQAPENTIDRRLDFLNVEPAPQQINMGRLTGVSFAHEFQMMMGIEGRAKEVENIDFRKNISIMWRAKLERYKRNAGDYSPTLLQAAQKAISEYSTGDQNSSSLSAENENINTIINSLRRKINFVAIGNRFKSSNSKKRLFDRLQSFITSKSLLNYSLTEIMPPSNGTVRVGISMFDFLLKHAGTKFLDFIPALNDDLLSMGPYQFTPPALSDAITFQARYLTGGTPLTRDVSELRMADNHAAAFLFGLNNLVFAIDKIENLDHLLDNSFTNNLITTVDVEDFLTAAHHSPVRAYEAFKKFLELNLDYKRTLDAENRKPARQRRSGGVTRPNYLIALISISPRVSVYSQRSRRNRIALDNAFRTNTLL